MRKRKKTIPEFDEHFHIAGSERERARARVREREEEKVKRHRKSKGKKERERERERETPISEFSEGFHITGRRRKSA